MTVHYSIETLLHFTCDCGGIWTQSVTTEFDHPNMPDIVICPRCGTKHLQLEDVTSKPLNYCAQHKIWYNYSECLLCKRMNTDDFHNGYVAGLHDAPKLMELPGE